MEINEKELAKAREVYADICAMLDEEDWKYDKEEDKFKITFNLRGEDIPMHFYLYIDPSPGFVRLGSWLPFSISKEKMVDAAIATCAINYRLTNGTFDFDISDGSVGFRVTHAYFGGEIEKEVFEYMVYMAASIVDAYNDKYMMLSKGNLALKDFLEEINK